MDPLPEFLRPLEFLVRPFPRDSVVAAIQNREEAIPHLLRSLEWVEQHVEEANDERTYMLHLFALYLLAQFRETRAYPLVIRLFRNPEYDALTDDIATDALPRILASVCGGDIEPIQSLIEDRELDEWVRAAGVNALGVLLFTGSRPREELSSYIGELFTRRLEREPTFVWDALVGVCADFRMAEHLPAVRRAYADHLTDPTIETLRDVEKELTVSSGTPTRATPTDYVLIDDTIAEMQDWYCFDPESEFDDAEDDEGAADEDDSSPEEQGEPYLPEDPVTRDGPKIGRNELCPCGSGKKYKKCCGKS